MKEERKREKEKKREKKDRNRYCNFPNRRNLTNYFGLLWDREKGKDIERKAKTKELENKREIERDR